MSPYYDAFISYGRKDSLNFARQLHQKLMDKELNVWFDQRNIDDSVKWQKEIDKGIEKSHNFIFIVAPHAVKSPYCRQEIELAVKYSKRIIPILYLEPTDCWDRLHPQIAEIQFIPYQEDLNNFEKFFVRLLNSIQKHADYVEQHTKYLIRGLKWRENQRKTKYLLIGEERVKAESWLKVRFKDGQPPCLPTDLHCEYICESTKNAYNLLTKVFISHAEKDQKIRNKIDKYLRREGLTIWTNKSDIKTGVEFQTEINRGIEGADNFIYLMSPDSLQSKYCQEELKHALSHNKRIIPLLIKPLDIEQIPQQLRVIEFIDFNKDKTENYHQSLSQLLKVLDRDCYYYEQHKNVLVKSLKWQKQNYNPSILLRGYNLQYYQTWLKVALSRQENPPLPIQKEFISASATQPTESSLEVFISYSRADADFARKLNDNLQELGKTTWFDQESIPPGSDFKQEIYKGIENCDNFVFIISPRSINSPYCQDEVEYGQKLNKRFVTILHQKIKTKELHPALAKVQWINFDNHDGDFYANFGELIRILDTDRDHVKNHTKWSNKAHEWLEKQKNADLLLRGSELSIAQKWLEDSENKQPFPTELHQEYILVSKAYQDNLLRQEEERRERELDIIKEALAQEKRAVENEKKARQVAQSRNRILVSFMLMMIGLTGLSAFFWREAMKQSLNSQLNALSSSAGVLLAEKKEFDALIESIKAGKQIKEKSGIEYDTRVNILATLHKSLDLVKERNRLQDHNYSVNTVAFSPDGQIIASGSDDATIKIWQRDGSILKTIHNNQQKVDEVSFHPDGKIIASANNDGSIKLWNLEGNLIKTIAAHTGKVKTVTFSPDGQLIASAGDDKTIKLWNLDGNLLQTFSGHTAEVNSVKFSPDGQTIASGSWDYLVKLWHLDGTLILTLEGHKSNVYSVDFSPDGQKLVSGSWDGTIKLWHLDGTLILTIPEHDQNVNQVKFSPDGKTIVSTSNDSTIKLWHIDGSLKTTLWGHSDFVKTVSFSPDGQTLASGSVDNTIRLWKPNHKPNQTLMSKNDSFKLIRFETVSFADDNQTIATVNSNNIIQLWNLDGTLINSFSGHNDYVTAIKFSPDGNTIATASYDKTIKLWNRQGKLLKTLGDHKDMVNTLSFSPDGKMMATGSKDDTVKLWTSEGQLLTTLTGHNRDISSVVFSPNSKIIASGSWDHTIRLWNLQGEELLTIPAHTDAILTIKFSPDGKILVSSSRDGTIKLWDLKGNLLNSLTGFRSWVTTIIFSPTGQVFATGSIDGNVRLWSVKNKHIETLEGHDSEILALGFNQSAKVLTSISSDTTMINWNFDLDYQLETACNWVRDYLTTNPHLSEGDRQLCID
jgi:WD40 repeat protein